MTTVYTFDEEKAELLRSLYKDFKPNPNPLDDIVVTTAEESAPSYLEKLSQPPQPRR